MRGVIVIMGSLDGSSRGAGAGDTPSSPPRAFSCLVRPAGRGLVACTIRAVCFWKDGSWSASTGSDVVSGLVRRAIVSRFAAFDGASGSASPDRRLRSRPSPEPEWFGLSRAVARDGGSDVGTEPARKTGAPAATETAGTGAAEEGSERIQGRHEGAASHAARTRGAPAGVVRQAPGPEGPDRWAVARSGRGARVRMRRARVVVRPVRGEPWWRAGAYVAWPGVRWARGVSTVPP